MKKTLPLRKVTQLSDSTSNEIGDGVYNFCLPGGQASPDKGLLSEVEATPFSCPPVELVSWYVDGFNLYHAVDALKQPALKWLDLASLAQSYLKPGQKLSDVNFFTAFNSWDAEKRKRHVNYVTALESVGVKVHRANFDKVKKYCKGYDRYCSFNEEKQSDVGIGVTAVSDAYQKKASILYFITADSDQIPTFKTIRSGLPEAKIFLVTPPNRRSHARDLGNHAHSVFQLTAGRLSQHPLPRSILNDKGRVIATRPALYSPS